MTTGGALARTKRLTIVVAAVALMVLVVAGGLLFFSKDTNQPTASPTPVPQAAALEVTPAAVQLPSAGETKQLAAADPGGAAPRP